MNANSHRAIIAALLANTGIALAKLFAFAMTGSSSMLAESIHSFADTSNQALLLWGSKASRQKPTPLHPFGYGRERYFWSFVVALILFSLGSVFAIYEGVHKLLEPGEIKSPMWAVGVLICGLLLEGWSFRTAVMEAQHAKKTASWWQFIRKSRSPELPVIILEDFGALVGLLLALIGVVASLLTNNTIFDSIATLAIGLLLGIIAVVLAVEMKSLLIGESAAPSFNQTIGLTLEQHETVRRVIHYKTLHIGPDELLIAAKVEFDPSLELPQIANSINAIEQKLRELSGHHLWIFLEPDIYRPPTPTQEAEPSSAVP